MALFNESVQEIHSKIVYYGPGLCGKTTNLQYIYDHSQPEFRGEMISLATETERTLFFDFLPLALGAVRGFKVRFHLYTVPGQVFYQASRKLILEGVDGVVFVADSQVPRMEANLESLEDLELHLTERGIDIASFPLVLQYNKTDLGNAAQVEAMRRLLNPAGRPDQMAAALHGVGVLETMKMIAKQVLSSLASSPLPTDGLSAGQ